MNIDINLSGSGAHHYLPPQNSNGGVSSVRSSVQRQRILINTGNQKRNPLPLSYDPTLSDQRRRGGQGGFNFQQSLIQNSSADSRGHSGSSNGRAVQVISKKHILFGQSNNNSNNASQSTTRTNVLQQQNSHKRTIIQKLPLQRITSGFDQSPRNQAYSTQEAKISGRSQHGQTNNGPPMHPQRKMILPNQATNKHQLGFRRHQVMDITDDANTQSMNKLTIQNDEGATSSRDNLQNENHSQPPPYNVFYHGSNQDSINRFNSKKSLRDLKKQPSKHDLNGASFANKASDQQQLFQFTRKSNLIGENSLSSTRDKGQLFKIKKNSVIGQPQVENSQVPQIGKRKPLIIRKNNFIQNVTTSSIVNAQNDSTSTNNYNTIISGVTNRFNNTNNFNGTSGGMSEASQSQTRYGITQILKSLNSTQQSNDLQNSLQQTNQSLKESKLIRIKNSKKRLDTARKSRIQQIQQQDSTVNSTQNILQQNSLSQQPPDTRTNQPVLSFLQQKKRSFLIPKVKIDNTQFSATQSFNPNGGSKHSARQDSQRNNSQASAQQQHQQQLTNIYMGSSQQVVKKMSPRNEDIIQSDSITQPQKYVKRGQILRLLKKKNTQNENSLQRGETIEQSESIQKPSNSLTRIESKKDLGTLKKEESKNGLPQQKSQHMVQEDLIIHENLNDSSCTPGDLSFINATKFQVEQQPFKVDQEPTYYKQEPELQTSKIEECELQLQKEESTKDVENTPITDLPTEQLKQSEVDHLQIQPKLPAKIETQVNLKSRHYNHSANTVKSPIGTATSFKSQNSQQAGPNLDEIVKFPMRPGKALKLFLNQLTDYEKGEILDYQDIYFLGLNAQKVQGSPKNEHNCGYDDEKGDYKIIMKDHIGYRYEVLSFIGKGSFGTALKCFDHKLKEEVALKIVKNKKKYQYQAGIELKILNFLKENDPDDIMNVIHMKDYVIFRKHLCISFELLSMNLFEFLKINDFNGFDHNLIRRFAIQLLYALKYLKEFQIIHCDLKPENILLKEPNKSGIKIIDFGSSAFIDERVYTYIQSRFYRAPEIMLGIPYTCAIDMWSFGCIMAELYIGYPIFPGESENDQMSRIIEMVNIPSREVYEVSQRRQKFFNETQTGDYQPIMLNNSRGKMRKPGGKPLSMLIGDEDPDFLDFVEKCLDWNPDTRMSPDDALRHVWVLKGLPPQVLIHHQRMHNITTPELPEVVKDARDQFFLESTIQNENNSQLGGTRDKQSKQQSSHSKSNQNSSSKGHNIKNETLKSLERAQIKNQLHQLNHNKQHNQQSHINQPKGIVIHSKLNPNAYETAKAKEVLITSNDTKFSTIQNQGESGQPGFKRRVNNRQHVQKHQFNTAKAQ